MKLYRLTTSPPPPEAHALRHVPHVRRVQEIAGSDADNQQSLRQQMAEGGDGPHGQREPEAAPDANALAAQIVELGARADLLLKRDDSDLPFHHVNIRA